LAWLISSAMSLEARMAAADQGLTLVHFSA
jgi:hypothetical protein